MKNSWKQFSRISIFQFLVFIFFFSCHPTKKVATSTPVGADGDTAFAGALEAYKKNIPQFSALTIKGDVDYSAGNDVASFNMNLRIKKDSAIWMSASPFLGIEVVRILITPDSVKILDRLNNIYYSDKLETLRISFHAGVNMDVLQSLICASYITSSIQDTLRSLYVENPDYILSTVEKKKDLRADEQTSQLPFACDLWCTNPTMRVSKMILSEPETSRNVEAKYEDYRASDAGVFPYLTTITAIDEAAQKTALLRISVGKIISSSDVEMPFSIPKKFEHKRLVREK
ncbi:MAG TPA: DUF4292 domain-containing protein [Bacteroidia bacterium]|nr:DUF4292 domain-containing protein [Bacteroidia bacterium]